MYILEINSSNGSAYYVYKNNYVHMIATLCTNYPSWKILYSDKNTTFNAKLTVCQVDGDVNRLYDILTSYYQDPKDCNVFMIDSDDFTPGCNKNNLDCNTYDYVCSSPHINSELAKSFNKVNQINQITKFSYPSDDDDENNYETDEYQTDIDSDSDYSE